MKDYNDFSFLPETLNRYNWGERPKFPELKPWEKLDILEPDGWTFYRYVNKNNYNQRAMYARRADGVWFEYHGDFRTFYAIGYE